MPASPLRGFVLISFLIVTIVMWVLLCVVAKRRRGSFADHAPPDERGGLPCNQMGGRVVRRRTVLGTLALLVVALAAACEDGATAPRGRVPIMSNFGSKIVYGTSRRLDVVALREHCENLGGEFNQCGTICAPDASVCPAVCAYTCEEIPR